jgi:triacylglycerol lipase
MRQQENIGLGRVTGAVKKPAEAAAEAAEQASTPQDAAAAAGKAGAASLGSSLGSLPASLTSFLLSIVDSPAYGNRTTAFLSGQFNADTPDDPRVSYFSVAARVPSANIWHPRWLPKLVLDGAEKRARAAAAAAGDLRAAIDAVWGNDGLVSVQSAR